MIKTIIISTILLLTTLTASAQLGESYDRVKEQIYNNPVWVIHNEFETPETVGWVMYESTLQKTWITMIFCKKQRVLTEIIWQLSSIRHAERIHKVIESHPKHRQMDSGWWITGPIFLQGFEGYWRIVLIEPHPERYTITERLWKEGNSI